MRLLLDQGTPRSAAAMLRASGVDAIHTSELGLSTAEDEQLICKALEEERLIVTLDADFHAFLALSGANKPSVIRIRIEGLRADALVRVIKDVLLQCKEDLKLGAMVSVQEHRIRVHRLPVGESSRP